MSSLEERKNYIIERIANMVVFGATMESIMSATNLKQEDLDRIQQWPEYGTRIAELQAEHFEQQQLIERGWDFLEAKSIENLSKVVEYNRDPDLNLRIARVANQASRNHKGKHNIEQPINPDRSMAKTVVLNLGINFVNNIQERQIDERRDAPVTIEHQKDVDCLSQTQVEKIFGISNGRNHADDAAEEFVQDFA